ncbi:DUF2711 family protein [Porphyrobacter sp. LM 6]|uniref:DUF2711 family protein n=1 Tax=Porphyrobacter sp. LM 6 TaxID=1896196 RepID=UPI000847B9BD|nr:DUF2711 family protein [Porphyrobacter sp. LM 6]AOL95321.1 Protein of unknown function (DUF2711) [Porphyrobacter sp. LM 6]
MTEIERSKWPPPEDDAMLPWYKGVFDAGFIALHPFFTVEGLDPSACVHGTMVFARSEMPEGASLLEWMDEEGAARREGKEVQSGSMPGIAKGFGRPIGWGKILATLGMNDHCMLDCALRTDIKGLRKEFADEVAARRLTDYCAREKIFLPTEGVIQPLMEASLIAMLRRAGISEVILSNEFGDEERLMPLDALEDEEPWDLRDDLPKWGVRRIIAPDRSLLVWVHWDSFYTAIFGTRARLEAARPEEGFEGFWCTPATTTYWLLEEAVPLAGGRV